MRSGPDLAICGGLVFATLAVYAQTAGFGFVNFDDVRFLAGNRYVEAGLTLDSVRWAFTNGTAGIWQPLTWLSLMLDYELFGGLPGGAHATNVLLHLINTLLLFVVLKRASAARWRSALVAALFALHPLHVESVAWIFERKDVLSACFGLLAIGSWCAYARAPSLSRYLAVVVLFACSLMSKPMLVTLPLLLLLLDYWPLQRVASLRLLVEKLPLLALAGVFAGVTVLLQKDVGAVSSLDPLPLAARCANAVITYVAYLGKTFWPMDLAVFYPHPYLPATGGLEPARAWVAICAALLVLLTGLALAARSRRYLLLGWFWYLGSLVPVIGLVQVGTQGMADRYTYVPLIGIFIALVWGAAEGVEALRPRFASARRAAGVVATVVLVGLGTTAWLQVGHWRDSPSLFQHAIDAVPRNPTMRYNVGNHHGRHGRTDEAIRHYRIALEAAPRDVKVHLNLGNALRKRGESGEAIEHYQQVLAIQPNDVLAHTNLGATLRGEGRLEEAMAHYRRSLEIRPTAQAAYNLANVLREDGKLEEGIAAFRRALQMRPRDPRIHNNLASALYARGEVEPAMTHWRQTLQLDPRHVRAHANLGSVLHEQGELEEAIALYQRALELNPDHNSARLNLGAAYADLGSFDLAIEQYRLALARDPDSAVGRRLLEEALAAVKSAGEGASAR